MALGQGDGARILPLRAARDAQPVQVAVDLGVLLAFGVDPQGRDGPQPDAALHREQEVAEAQGE
ncbi:MAG: hypothetical protein ACYTDU_13420, partial [Planctomycetota bacterium]